MNVKKVQLLVIQAQCISSTLVVTDFGFWRGNTYTQSYWNDTDYKSKDKKPKQTLNSTPHKVSPCKEELEHYIVV